MHRPRIFSALLLFGLCIDSASAADSPWWKFWGNVAAEGATVAAQEVAPRHFTPEQQRLLREFLTRQQAQAGGEGDDDERDADKHGKEKKGGKKEKALPPGLRKKVERGGQLPPGWQKKLARGEVVDAEVWGQSRPLPQEVLERMGVIPPDSEIRYVEDKVFRVLRDSREIIDILGL